MPEIELQYDSDFPEVSANIWSEMEEAPPWKRGNFNEENIFETMYGEIATAYYTDAVDVNAAGRQVLKLFQKWRPLVSQFTRHVLRGDVDDPLDAVLDWDAEGAGQAVIRPLGTYSDDVTSLSYAQTPDSTGQFGIFPDDTESDGTQITATDNEQAFIVFGYTDNYAGNVVPYDYVQEQVNDDIGARRPVYLKHQMESEGTMGVASRERGPLFVEPGFDLDIDANIVETGIETALRPVGIEVVRADADEYAAILD